ncbi:MAG TPA: Mu-like prophage major head subunit gpT family protein [Mesorhizobium sp.]|jgi:phage major head subunit gpT-like protein|uniref:Mu-like prophage major head subunit gpT family protein n=1 Tax=Mesorhizobium sp. TaxID=1871066 RepID=UPI002DDCD562|nr:Mu-like prophage major head subunit gpT family protein [Mesorhizobium sp.]HEV2501612.1 Mu-like prophage major head subunit gpT family protein [Mesorhizobium sp.]
MDINASTLRAVFTGLSTAFNVRLAATATMYSTVAMTVTSSTAANEYPRLDDLPGIREWVGDRFIHNLSAQTYLIRNKEFEGTIGIKRSAIEDDQFGFYTPIAAQMGQNAAEFPDQLVWPLLKKGDATLCYDGQNFFDNDHPGFDENGGETSVSNITPGAGPAWYLVDDTQVIQPLIFQQRKKFKLVQMDRETDANVFMRGQYLYGVDGRCNAGFGLWHLAHQSKAELNAANFKLAREAMGAIRKKSGQVINIKPAKLLVPQTLEAAARQVVEAQLINGGDSNIWFKTAEVVVVPQLG